MSLQYLCRVIIVAWIRQVVYFFFYIRLLTGYITKTFSPISSILMRI